MIDGCLGPIGTHGGSRLSKERASEVSCAEWFGVLMSITYGLKETQESMETSKQRKSKWRVGKDVKFRMMFKGNHSEENYLL